LGQITGLDAEGPRVRVRVSGVMPNITEVTPAAVAELHLDQSGEVWVSAKATEINAYPTGGLAERFLHPNPRSVPRLRGAAS